MKIIAVNENPRIPCPSGQGGWITEGGNGEGRKLPSVSLSGKEILLQTDGRTVRVTGCIWNDDESDPAFRAQYGGSDLISEGSRQDEISVIGNCRVFRITTELKLRGAVAYTDLYLWKDRPLVTLLTYFDAIPGTGFRNLVSCQVAADTDGVSLYSDGSWKDCGTEYQSGAAVFHLWGDLSGYDAFHPFVSHIAYDDERPELPEFVALPECKEGNTVLENGDLTVTLEKSENRLGLCSILDRKSGYLLRPSPLTPLFSLILRRLDSGEEYALTSLYGWSNLSCEKHPDGMDFLFENGDVRLQLTARMENGENSIDWEIDVRIRNGDLTAVRLDAPVLRTDSQDDMTAFVALGPGRSIPFRKGVELNYTGRYPSILYCMQYAAFYRKSTGRGIYCGLHDPSACSKFLSACQHSDQCSFQAFIPCRGIEEPANSFRMEGSVKWKLFDGDWYDATVLYRDWVYRFARWFTGVKNEDRKDVPDWMRRLPLWFMTNCAEGNGWVDELFEAADDIGIDTGVHVYNWHEIPFDTNYPHYKPAKRAFERMLPVLQAKGLKVMPYINGRLWDTHDRGDFDYQFSRLAKPFVTKGNEGRVVIERYESRNSKGEKVELGVMCPSTALWQEKQIEINDWLLNELGADAVYVDQIAAAHPVSCTDRTHPHRPGGGSWWYEHYYNLIDHLMLHAPEGKGYTTESNAEPFVGHISGMLVWHWSGNYNVPAFPVIYAGYETMLGRNFNAFSKQDTVSFRVTAAQSLCFGEEVGWLTPSLYLSSPYRGFFRDCARARSAYGEYFYQGTCMRPPVTEGDIPVLSSSFLSSPAVLSGRWQRNRDGKQILILANVSESPLGFTVKTEDLEDFSCCLNALEVKVIEL